MVSLHWWQHLLKDMIRWSKYYCSLTPATHTRTRYSAHCMTTSSPTAVLPSLAMQDGNTLLHIVAGKGNYDALKTFLDSVQLPEMNAQNQVKQQEWMFTVGGQHNTHRYGGSSPGNFPGSVPLQGTCSQNKFINPQQACLQEGYFSVCVCVWEDVLSSLVATSFISVLKHIISCVHGILAYRYCLWHYFSPLACFFSK